MRVPESFNLRLSNFGQHRYNFRLPLCDLSTSLHYFKLAPILKMPILIAPRNEHSFVYCLHWRMSELFCRFKAGSAAKFWLPQRTLAISNGSFQFVQLVWRAMARWSLFTPTCFLITFLPGSWEGRNGQFNGDQWSQTTRRRLNPGKRNVLEIEQALSGKHFREILVNSAAAQHALRTVL